MIMVNYSLGQTGMEKYKWVSNRVNMTMVKGPYKI